MPFAPIELARIVSGAIASTAASVGAFGLHLHLERRRKDQNPNHQEYEKSRAQEIALNIGTLSIHLVQFAAGIAAGIPAFALLIFISSASSLPKIKDVGLFAALFVGGWVVFAWCLRITDARAE